MRKPFFFCISENKDADQLRSNCAADQRLCFRNMDSTISLLPKFENLHLQSFSAAVQPSLYRTQSVNPQDWFFHDAAQVITYFSIEIIRRESLDRKRRSRGSNITVLKWATPH